MLHLQFLKSPLHKLLKASCAGALGLACIATFLLSYAYLGGDFTDRQEMKQTADHYASYLRLVPQAQAQSQDATVDFMRSPASVDAKSEITIDASLGTH